MLTAIATKNYWRRKAAAVVCAAVLRLHVASWTWITTIIEWSYAAYFVIAAIVRSLYG